MPLVPAEETVRGDAALARVAPDLADLVREVRARPLPPGVVGYAVGDGPRDEARQEQLLAATPPRTRAAFGQSAHSWLDEDGNALAVDIFPLRLLHGDRVVSGQADDYAVIGEVARSKGLTWGGDWQSFRDPAHVEVPDWRRRRPAVEATGGAAALLLLLAIALWRTL